MCDIESRFYPMNCLFPLGGRGGARRMPGGWRGMMIGDDFNLKKPEMNLAVLICCMDDAKHPAIIVREYVKLPPKKEKNSILKLVFGKHLVN